MSEMVRRAAKGRVVLRGGRCTYCGAWLAEAGGGEQEHVIGRRFVPKGTLAGQWNLIVPACGPCNDHKADLENDISAITMQPDVRGRFAVDDERLAREAARKAATQNRRTKRRVSEPPEPIVVNQNFGGFEMSMSFSGPAQPDEMRMFELARLQLTGFFSMLTWDEAVNHGWWWTGVFAPLVSAPRSDWGHPHLRWIDDVSSGWLGRLHAVAADGFYKAWIRRRLDEPAVWSWAIEWNHNYRLAGLFGDEGEIEELTKTLPPLRKMVVRQSPDLVVRLREEIALPAEDDRLFVA